MKWVYFCRLKSHLPNSMFKIFSYSKNKVKKKINLVGRPEGLDCSGCAINIKDCSGVNFTNILPTSSFLYENIFLQFFSNYMCSFVFFGKRILAQKLNVQCWWYWLQAGWNHKLPEKEFPEPNVIKLWIAQVNGGSHPDKFLKVL